MTANDLRERPRTSRTLRFLGISALVTVGAIGAALLSWPVLDARLLPYFQYLALKRQAFGRLADKERLAWEEATSRTAAFMTRPWRWFRFRSGLWGSTSPEGPEHVRPPPTPQQAAAANALAGLCAPNADKPVLAVLFGAPASGKTTVLRQLGSSADPHRVSHEGPAQPIVYVSCRNFNDPATFLYALMTHVVVPRTGLVGDFVMAYHKLYNGIVDVLTMNQQHNHVSFILYCQLMGHLRAALRHWETARTEPPPSGGDAVGRPIIVVDHAEQLVRNSVDYGRASDTSVFGRMLVDLLVRTAIDERLAHVVFAFDSTTALAPLVSSHSGGGDLHSATVTIDQHHSTTALTATRLGTQFPELITRAQLLTMPPDTAMPSFAAPPETWAGFSRAHVSEVKKRFVTAATGTGARPLLLQRIAEHLRRHERVTATDLMLSCGVGEADATASLEALGRVGLLQRVTGAVLGAKTSCAAFACPEVEYEPTALLHPARSEPYDACELYLHGQRKDGTLVPVVVALPANSPEAAGRRVTPAKLVSCAAHACRTQGRAADAFWRRIALWPFAWAGDACSSPLQRELPPAANASQPRSLWEVVTESNVLALRNGDVVRA